jgi:hypothetical protein
MAVTVAMLAYFARAVFLRMTPASHANGDSGPSQRFDQSDGTCEIIHTQIYSIQYRHAQHT